jgi:hypothetical protein
MGIEHKNVFVGTNADGSETVFKEYSAENYADRTLGQGLIPLLLFGLLAGIGGPLFMVLGVLSYNGRFNYFFIPSLLFSSYIVYDASNGWLILSLLNIFLEPGAINFLFHLNVATIFVSILMLVGYGVIRAINSLQTYWFAVLTAFVIGFFVAKVITFEFGERWVYKKLKSREYSKEYTENPWNEGMTPAQIRAKYNIK